MLIFLITTSYLLRLARIRGMKFAYDIANLR